jgi:hypothetical protein
MSMSRLLILLLLTSVYVLPVAAQSSPSPDNSAVSAQAGTLSQDVLGTVAVDRSRPPNGLNLSPLTPGAPGGVEHGLAAAELRNQVLKLGDVTCYSIRAYRVTRDDPKSDTTRAAGYSTCQPASRYQMRTAVDTVTMAPR